MKAHLLDQLFMNQECERCGLNFEEDLNIHHYSFGVPLQSQRLKFVYIFIK